MGLLISDQLYPRHLLEEVRRRLRKRSLTSAFPVFLFVCGKRLVDNGPSSNRDWIIRFFADSHAPNVYLVIAERMLLSPHQSTTPDLLTIEQFMAHASDAILLFLESMGTSAELGAFASVAALPEKCTVFVDRRYLGVESFIELGPLTRLRNHRAKVIYGDLNAISSSAELWQVLQKLPHGPKLLAPNVDPDRVFIPSYCVELLDLVSLVGPVSYSDILPLYKSLKGFDMFRFAHQPNLSAIVPLDFLLLCGALEKVDEYVTAKFNAPHERLLTTLSHVQFQRLRSKFLARKFKYLPRANRPKALGGLA